MRKYEVILKSKLGEFKDEIEIDETLEMEDEVQLKMFIEKFNDNRKEFQSRRELVEILGYKNNDKKQKKDSKFIPKYISNTLNKIARKSNEINSLKKTIVRFADSNDFNKNEMKELDEILNNLSNYSKAYVKSSKEARKAIELLMIDKTFDKES